MNPHRHGHLNPPGGKGGGWHKDCYVFDHNIRQPRFHWILALYYPQDVTEEMGPTAVLPRRQNYDLISDVDPAKTTEDAVPIVGPAGTIALTHFDSWHRACENRSARKRYMIKFQFTRMVEPRQPNGVVRPNPSRSQPHTHSRSDRSQRSDRERTTATSLHVQCY